MFLDERFSILLLIVIFSVLSFFGNIKEITDKKESVMCAALCLLTIFISAIIIYE